MGGRRRGGTRPGAGQYRHRHRRLPFTASNVFNSDWDPAAESGRVFGSYIFGSDDETWEGHFAGRMVAEESDGMWDGRSDRGRRLAGTFAQVGEGVYQCEWYVLGLVD